MWFIYRLPPIDNHWEYLKTVEETAKELAAIHARERVARVDFGSTVTFQSFIDDWDSAQDAAGANGWEGDFRQDPRVFWVPFDGEFSYGFTFKQDNNGTTFVVSPVALPHLNEFAAN